MCNSNVEECSFHLLHHRVCVSTDYKVFIVCGFVLMFQSIWVGSSTPFSLIKLLSSVASSVTLPSAAKDVPQHERHKILINKLTSKRLHRIVKSSAKMCHVKAMATNARLEAVSFQGSVPYKTCATWINEVPRSTTKTVRAINKMKHLRYPASSRKTMDIEKAKR